MLIYYEHLKQTKPFSIAFISKIYIFKGFV